MSEASPLTSSLLAGKRGLVMGVANNRSIAWGIARAAHAHGAELAFTYQGEALEKRVRPLAAELGAACRRSLRRDGRRHASTRSSPRSRELFGRLDFVVHCIAFSDKDELTGRYLETSEANFTKSLLISCYSFTAIAQRAEKLMRQRRLDADADLLRRRKVDAALQRHGRRQGRAGGIRPLPRRRSRPAATSASTPFPPARSRRWPRPASATSATSCAGTSTTRRCAAP